MYERLKGHRFGAVNWFGGIVRWSQSEGFVWEAGLFCRFGRLQLIVGYTETPQIFPIFDSG